MTKEKLDVKDFRRALGGFATGVTIVSTRDKDGRNWGFTANSFTSVSLEPPLVLACIAKSAYSYRIFLDTHAFSVNVLGEHQKDLASTFSRQVEDRFDGASFRTETTGCPIFDDVVAWFDCAMHDTVDAGDHIIMIGKVLKYDHTDITPLGYCRGAWVSFGVTEEILRSSALTGNICVGAIIEHEQRILVRTSAESDVSILPTASSIGNCEDSQSLLGRLQQLGIETRLPFVYAVYDDNGMQNVYYRDEIEKTPAISESADYRWFGFDEIPWSRIDDQAVRVMLTRYVNERRNDSFGIYVGNAESGEVHQSG